MSELASPVDIGDGNAERQFIEVWARLAVNALSPLPRNARSHGRPRRPSCIP
jgi:hypothetical protein